MIRNFLAWSTRNGYQAGANGSTAIMLAMGCCALAIVVVLTVAIATAG